MNLPPLPFLCVSLPKFCMLVSVAWLVESSTCVRIVVLRLLHLILPPNHALNLFCTCPCYLVTQCNLLAKRLGALPSYNNDVNVEQIQCFQSFVGGSWDVVLFVSWDSSPRFQVVRCPLCTYEDPPPSPPLFVGRLVKFLRLQLRAALMQYYKSSHGQTVGTPASQNE